MSTPRAAAIASSSLAYDPDARYSPSSKSNPDRSAPTASARLAASPWAASSPRRSSRVCPPAAAALALRSSRVTAAAARSVAPACSSAVASALSKDSSCDTPCLPILAPGLTLTAPHDAVQGQSCPITATSPGQCPSHHQAVYRTALTKQSASQRSISTIRHAPVKFIACSSRSSDLDAATAPLLVWHEGYASSISVAGKSSRRHSSGSPASLTTASVIQSPKFRLARCRPLRSACRGRRRGSAATPRPRGTGRGGLRDDVDAAGPVDVPCALAGRSAPLASWSRSPAPQLRSPAPPSVGL